MSHLREVIDKRISRYLPVRVLLTLARIVRQEGKGYLRNGFQRKKRVLPALEKKILDDLRNAGYHIITGYYTSAQCRELREEIDRLIAVYRQKVWVDPVGADTRIFGADLVSPLIARFFHDPFLNRIIYSYENADKLNGCTLAARLAYQPGNLGSGQGWHRDRTDRRQTKAILYLNDVDESLGPFQYLEGSHRPWSIFKDLIRGKLGFYQDRFIDKEINDLIEIEPARLQTLTAKEGTLILVDTRGIHRGMPMTNKSGCRYALTNYLWPEQIPAHVRALMVE